MQQQTQILLERTNIASISRTNIASFGKGLAKISDFVTPFARSWFFSRNAPEGCSRGRDSKKRWKFHAQRTTSYRVAYTWEQIDLAFAICRERETNFWLMVRKTVQAFRKQIHFQCYSHPLIQRMNCNPGVSLEIDWPQSNNHEQIKFVLFFFYFSFLQMHRENFCSQSATDVSVFINSVSIRLKYLSTELNVFFFFFSESIYILLFFQLYLTRNIRNIRV